MREVIRRALRAGGYQVDVASTLAEAHAMDPGGYDAVLVDANLGGEHGTDLVEALRSGDPAAAARCVVISGGTLDTVPAGVARLAKPFGIRDLLDAVRAVIDPRRSHVPDPDGLAPPDRRPDARTPRQPGTGTPWQDAGTPWQDAGTPWQDAGAPSPENGQAAAGQPLTWRVLAVTRKLRAREHRGLVDYLHDGPIQELTAATLELQLLSRSLPAATPRSFDTALERLHAAAASMRWLVDGRWPFLQPETDLADAVEHRTAWLLAGPVQVETGEGTAGLRAAEIPVVVDVVELMLFGTMCTGGPVRAGVAVRPRGHVIQIELTLTALAPDNHAIGDPAAVRAWLDRVAAALAATARSELCGPRWQLQITLDRQPAGALADELA